MTGTGYRITRVCEAIIKNRDDVLHANYQSTLLDELRAPEFSLKV